MVQTAAMKKLTALSLALPLALSGCISYHIQDDGITRAQIGETVRVDGPSVTPLKLLEDSRCPKAAQCVWAGQVRISATVSWGSTVSVQELTLGKPVPVADGQLTLVEATPDRRADTTLYPEDYRFGFTFAGGL